MPDEALIIPGAKILSYPRYCREHLDKRKAIDKDEEEADDLITGPALEAPTLELALARKLSDVGLMPEEFSTDQLRHWGKALASVCRDWKPPPAPTSSSSSSAASASGSSSSSLSSLAAASPPADKAASTMTTERPLKTASAWKRQGGITLPNADLLRRSLQGHLDAGDKIAFPSVRSDCDGMAVLEVSLTNTAGETMACSVPMPLAPAMSTKKS